MKKRTRENWAVEGRAKKTESPSFPMAVVIQEASDLAQICGEADVRARLFAVGLSPARLAELRARVSATQAAESAWIAVRAQARDPGEVELLTRAHRLLREIRAVASFHLRGTPEEEVLKRLKPGRSYFAVVQTLLDHAYFLEKFGALLQGDRSFDLRAAESDAFELHGALMSADGRFQRREAIDAAKRHRDATFTALKELTSEVRAAARYAFRDDPAAVRRFASPYRRKMRGPRVHTSKAQPSALAA